MTRNEAIAHGKEQLEIFGGTHREFIRMAIEALERKRGEWIKKHDEYWNVYWYECSVCGRKPPNDTFGQEWQPNYCPNCGAKMDESEEKDG